MDSTMNPMTKMASAGTRIGAVPVGELLRWPGAPARCTAPDPDGNALEIVEVKP
jgi:hypothetical protein